MLRVVVGRRRRCPAITPAVRHAGLHHPADPLGLADFGVTSVYLQGIDNAEVIGRIHGRTAPMMPASVGLQL